MGTETLELHHGKHHQAYVTALNGFVEKNDALKGKSLEEIILLAKDKADLAPVFNNAGQHWNHNLFWQNLSASGGRLPGALERKSPRISAVSTSSRKPSRPQPSASSVRDGHGWFWPMTASSRSPRRRTAPIRWQPAKARRY